LVRYAAHPARGVEVFHVGRQTGAPLGAVRQLFATAIEARYRCLTLPMRTASISCLAVVLLTACSGARRVEPRERPPPLSPPQPVPAAPSGLYSAEEALRDVLSSPLQFVGTGKWPGVQRMYACAYRNQRVTVVDAYCSRNERQAFRVDVYSAQRGRVRIYAESPGKVSAHQRSDYFTFMVESEPPSALKLSASASFVDLKVYEQQRYDAFLPVCFAGHELKRARSGCLGALENQDQGWLAYERGFLAHASPDWYRVVHQLRALAGQHGREPD
jgi:hypothetical protein